MDDRDDGADDDSSATVRIGSTTASPSDATDDGSPDLDDLLRVLSTRRRRYALYCLREYELRNRTALARYVAAEVAETSPADVADGHVEEIETMLGHADIPLLEDAGIVSFDPRTETLRLDSPPTDFEPLLDACLALEEFDSSTCDPSTDTASDDVQTE